MGENIGNDEDIMPYITSANIACGFHAGDEIACRRPSDWRRSMELLLARIQAGKIVEGFGRREMSFPPDEVEALISVSNRRVGCRLQNQKE